MPDHDREPGRGCLADGSGSIKIYTAVAVASKETIKIGAESLL